MENHAHAPISRPTRKIRNFCVNTLIAVTNGNGNQQKIGPMVETDHTTQKLLGVYQAISGVQMALAKLGIEKSSKQQV